MIKANELRIGNLILKNGKLHYTNYMTIRDVFGLSVTDKVKFEPITLTEEWLLKFGFEKRNDGDFNLLKFSEVDIVIDKDFDCWKCDGIYFSVNALQYVHQLQNLYFALTGEELKFK